MPETPDPKIGHDQLDDPGRQCDQKGIGLPKFVIPSETEPIKHGNKQQALTEVKRQAHPGTAGGYSQLGRATTPA